MLNKIVSELRRRVFFVQQYKTGVEYSTIVDISIVFNFQ